MKQGDRVLAAIILIFGVVAVAWWLRPASGDLVAEIKLNGQVIKTINLSQVQEPYQFTIHAGQEQYNVVRVERGRIRVVEANCPNQIDVKQGWITAPGQTIVCLPHRLVITIRGKAEPSVDDIVR